MSTDDHGLFVTFPPVPLEIYFPNDSLPPIRTQRASLRDRSELSRRLITGPSLPSSPLPSLARAAPMASFSAPTGPNQRGHETGLQSPRIPYADMVGPLEPDAIPFEQHNASYNTSLFLPEEDTRPTIMISPPPGFSGNPVVLRQERPSARETAVADASDFSAAVRAAINFPENLPIPLPIAMAIYSNAPATAAAGGDGGEGGMTVRDRLLPEIFGNSRAWISPEERVRINYKKFQTDMYHLGGTESFVFPRTEAEFAGLMADLHSASARHLAGKAHRLEREKDRQAALAAEARRTTAPAMRGRTFKVPPDGLSAALCMPTSFNDIWTSPHLPPEERVDWPTAQQLTLDGDNRIRKGEEFRRFLPMPRKNTLDPRLAAKFRRGNGKAVETAPGMEHQPYGVAASADRGRREVDEVPWAMRQIVGERWDLHHYERHEEKYGMEISQYIAHEEAPNQIRRLIAEIDEQLVLEE